MIRIIQVTDCHLGPNPDYALAGVRTLSSFREVVARLVEKESDSELVVASGDVAAYGSDPAYQAFLEEMNASGLPYTWLPGNHDDFSKMLAEWCKGVYTHIKEVGKWRIIALNTAVPGQVGGHLSNSELESLSSALVANKSHPVAIFMHHPPMNVGCRWLDKQQVANGQQLAELLAGQDHVKAIFTGHVHQEGEFSFAGIPLFTTPSTCFQFTRNQDDFGVDTLPPAYRWINLHDDGRLETAVEWISDTSQIVNPDVQGY